MSGQARRASVGGDGNAVSDTLGSVTLPQILDHLPAMVAFYDLDGRNRFANQAYADWFGSSVECLHGRHISEILGEDLYALNEPYVTAVLQAGEPQSFERTIREPGASARYVQADYIPHLSDGALAGFVVMISEISSRVRAEKALQDGVRQIALLEERQRIAADLHDLVIQRLFAAGLDLNAAMRAGTEHDDRVNSAAIGVDEAIRELRRSIYSLRELMTPTQVPATVEKILSNAGRMLGFMPTITYTGSLEVLPAAAVQDLLAVLNEALSNVARHADATEVTVTIACTDEEVLLQVTDDGRGIHDAERSSGLTNMRRRAERHSGAFVCRENAPRGTIVLWTIPLAT